MRRDDHAHSPRPRRRVAALCLAAALGVSSVPATAAEVPTDWWWDAYGVGAIHDQGLTGKGVKIAVIDANINPDLPSFAGRNLTVDPRPLCAEATSATSATPTEDSVHGTTLTASLIGTGEGGGNVRGIAPDADVTFYSQGTSKDTDECTVAAYKGSADGQGLSLPGLGIQRAVDDGAQIITTSIAVSMNTTGDAEVLANAIAKGVVVIVATENPHTPVSFLALERLNGVVAASAVDKSGQLQVNSDGQPFALPGTNVAAPGIDLPTVGNDSGTWQDSSTAAGSSFAAPLVAGMLALVKQRYPEATGNQLIQTLIRNTGVNDHELTNDPVSGYGYGLAWVAHMLQKDPTQYPDENPLMGKPDGVPTTDQISAAAARGFAFPTTSDSATTPVAPRDTQETAREAAPLQPALIIVLALLAVIVVAGVVAAVLITNRKKKNSPEGGAS